jgi:ABC-2 type transport system permease protein
MEEAEYCDRIALIDQGRIIARGTPDELRAAAPDTGRADPTFEDAFIAYVRRFGGAPDDGQDAGGDYGQDAGGGIGQDARGGNEKVAGGGDEKVAGGGDEKVARGGIGRAGAEPAAFAGAKSDPPESAASSGPRKLRALVVKEFKQIARDVSSYIVALVLPMIFLLLFGYGITLDAGIMTIAVIDESGGPSGLQLRVHFSHSPHFRVVSADSRATAGRMMRDSEIDGFIILASDFEARLDAGKAPAQVVVSGAEPNTANFIRAYSQGVIANWLAASASASAPASAPASGQGAPLSTEPRYWFNPAATSHWYLVPGSITMVMTLIGTMLTALVIAREWERGTLESLYATPVTRMQILLGKLIPYYALGLFSMSLCVLAGVYLFGLPFQGSVPALFALATAFLLPSLGQGLLISILTKEQLLAAQTGLLTAFLPAMMLSGFIFDINSMPLPLQWLTMLVPARYFNVSLQTVFLAGDLWFVFLPGMLYMLCLAGVFLSLTYSKLVKRLE